MNASRRASAAVFACAVVALLAIGCVGERSGERCVDNADCEGGQVCDTAEGVCVPFGTDTSSPPADTSDPDTPSEDTSTAEDTSGQDTDEMGDGVDTADPGDVRPDTGDDTVRPPDDVADAGDTTTALPIVDTAGFAPAPLLIDFSVEPIVALQADRRAVVVLTDQRVIEYPLEAGYPPLGASREWELSTPPTSMALLPDHIVVSHGSTTVIDRDTAEVTQLLSPAGGGIDSLAVAPLHPTAGTMPGGFALARTVDGLSQIDFFMLEVNQCDTCAIARADCFCEEGTVLVGDEQPVHVGRLANGDTNVVVYTLIDADGTRIEAASFDAITGAAGHLPDGPSLSLIATDLFTVAPDLLVATSVGQHVVGRADYSGGFATLLAQPALSTAVGLARVGPRALLATWDGADAALLLVDPGANTVSELELPFEGRLRALAAPPPLSEEEAPVMYVIVDNELQPLEVRAP